MTTVAVTASSSVLPQPTLGIAVTAALLHVKTLVKMVPAKAVAGKIAAATTAMPLAQHLAALVLALLVTSLVVAPSSLVPATSNPTPQLAKALRANAAAPVC